MLVYKICNSVIGGNFECQLVFVTVNARNLLISETVLFWRKTHDFGRKDHA
jgi:hypothetical protein